MKLSIITVTRNNLAGLRRTAESVAAQVWRDFEWIVIDGASTDGTKEFLQQLSPQPDWWKSEPDCGVYDAMNKGIAIAQGEYLLFLNAGDSLCNANTLQECFHNFPKGDIVYGDAFFIFPKKKTQMIHPDRLDLYYFRRHSLCHQATFIRTSLLKGCGGYSTKYRIASDWRQWLVWTLEERTFTHLPILVCNYMMDGLSCTQESASTMEREEIYRELLPQPVYQLMVAEEEVYRKRRKKHVTTCYYLAIVNVVLALIILLLCLLR